MVQPAHAAPADAALNPIESALTLSGQDCEGRNENPPAFQERTLFGCDLATPTVCYCWLNAYLENKDVPLAAYQLAER